MKDGSREVWARNLRFSYLETAHFTYFPAAVFSVRIYNYVVNVFMVFPQCCACFPYLFPGLSLPAYVKCMFTCVFD